MTKNYQTGQMLILAVVALTLIMISTVVLIGRALTFSQNSKYSLDNVQATNLAEAAIDKAVASLNKTAGSYNGETLVTLGSGQYSTVVTNKNSSTKNIKVTAYIPSQAKARATRTLNIDVSRGIGAAFNYGVQVGDGGLQLTGNNKINGSIYSDGNVLMTGDNNKITGDVYVAAGVAADPDQTYECTSSCTDLTFGRTTSTAMDVAQSFQLASSDNLNKVSLKLKRFGTSLPANLTVRIMGDTFSGGSHRPNKNDVKATATLSSSLVTATYSFVDVSFASPPSLSSSSIYWVMLDTASANNTNYWGWQQATIPGYNRGEPKWSTNWNASNPTWTAISGDLSFKVFTGGIPTSIDANQDGDTNVGEITGDAHANTIKDAKVDGSAYYQAISNTTVLGTQYPNSPDPGPGTFSLSDANIAEWKALAASMGVHNGDINNCPSTLPAGKYVGDFNMPWGCTTTVTSPIWITGDLNMPLLDKIKLDPSYGSSSGTVIVDGAINMWVFNKVSGSGTTGSYIILISEYNSKDDPQHRAAIGLFGGNNDGILYTNRGLVDIEYANHLTSVTGWKIYMVAGTTLDYDQGLAGAFFSSGPSGSYAPIKGTYQIK